MAEESPDYAVTIEIGVTAENAAMALDDIRDRCPWNVDVKNLGSGEIVGVSVGDPDGEPEDEDEGDEEPT
jgi:hypothetical protein